jgi:quercetin dioxygenase-like cupin family protein
MMEQSGVPPTQTGPAHAFAGEVLITPIAEPRETSQLVAALVRFAPGSRTHWHSHRRGQTLYVTEGEGLVVGRGGRILRVRAGDTVWTPPAEEHWHGGAIDTCMSHIGFVENDDDGVGTTWLEPVSDDDYEAACRGPMHEAQP